MRRNIALKLKPSVKDGGARRSPSEGGRRKEGEEGQRPQLIDRGT